MFPLGTLIHGKAGVSISAKLLKTGQTTKYVDNDDGDLEIGIAKSYTVLTTGQYLGTTDITLNGKTDAHSNNCVLDNNTGLMWSRYQSATVGASDDGKLPWTTNVDGEGIFAYCAAANAASLGGYADWRIPNIFEILSLFLYEAPATIVNSTYFPNPVYDLWTSTTRPQSTTQALCLNMQWNERYSTATKTTAYPLMLVRG